MTLAAYLARHQLSMAAFARLVGADRSRISRCVRGERRPGLRLALEIERATGGEVPASSWTGERRRSRKAPPTREALDHP